MMSTRDSAVRRSFLAVLATAALADVAVAQPSPTQPRFSEEAQVLAVDTVVELVRLGTWTSAAEPVPPDLTAADFEVWAGGRQLPVVGIEPPGRDAEPWTVLIYFDTLLHGDAELRWAAGLLAQQAAALTERGPVEVVVADPDPRTLLAATRDTPALSETLLRLALEAEGDEALVTLRQAIADGEAEAGEEPTEPPEPEELLGLEVVLVRDRLDALLLHLLAASPTTARRALLLAGAGFDLHPDRFYLQQETPSAFAGEARAFADSLAAYGWVVLQLASPLPENRPGLKPGLRIGKFRFRWGNDLGLLGFSATYEEDRDPEKAAAHLELARAQVGQGDLEAATESYRKAIFHFYGDPRTAEGQIEAWTGLGEVLERLGDAESARRAFEAARELRDRQAAKEGQAAEGGERIAEAGEKGPGESPAAREAAPQPPAGAADVDPAAAARLLAEATAGRAVRSADDLAEAVDSLTRRVRVTFQRDAGEGSVLEPLEVRLASRRFDLRAPAVTRSATPEAVAAARVRRLLASELPMEGGELEVRLLDSEGDTARLAISLEGFAEPGDRLRVTLGRAAPDGSIEVGHSIPGEDDRTPGDLRLEIPRDPRLPGLAVLVDNLSSGRWAATIRDLP